jgi:hypothetical protein
VQLLLHLDAVVDRQLAARGVLAVRRRDRLHLAEART